MLVGIVVGFEPDHESLTSLLGPSPSPFRQSDQPGRYAAAFEQLRLRSIDRGDGLGDSGLGCAHRILEPGVLGALHRLLGRSRRLRRS